MERHSTATALLSVTDQILEGMDHTQITLLTLIDLSRCFDVVDHATLLSSLKQLQISTGWLQSYLTGHTQRVRVGNILSDPRTIDIGTFQRSCLGPLLFNIVSNSISCYIPSTSSGFHCFSVRYADDSQVGITGPRDRLPELKGALEGILDALGTWFLQHGMRVNASKTELLLCGDRRQLTQISDPPQIHFMGQSLSLSQTEKNLGVIMDPGLTWDSHITHITNRCFGLLIGLMHIRHIVPPHLLPKIVNALVLSHVRYCVSVYGSANRTHILKLQKVYNFAARVISGRRKYDHISDVIRRLGWMGVTETISYFDLCLMHSVLTFGKPDVLRSWLTYNFEHVSRDTRQSRHFTLPRVRTSHGKRRFVYRAAETYNRFVISAGHSDLNIPAFKRAMREMLRL